MLAGRRGNATGAAAHDHDVELRIAGVGACPAAVGDPPISRWEYNGFSVYFEHDLALHSVIHHPVNK